MVITGEKFKYLYKCASFILPKQFKHSNCRNIQAAHSVSANTAGKTTSIEVKKKKKSFRLCKLWCRVFTVSCRPTSPKARCVNKEWPHIFWRCRRWSKPVVKDLKAMQQKSIHIISWFYNGERLCYILEMSNKHLLSYSRWTCDIKTNYLSNLRNILCHINNTTVKSI